MAFSCIAFGASWKQYKDMLFLQGFIGGNLVFGLFSFSFLKFCIALRSSILSLDNHLVVFLYYHSGFFQFDKVYFKFAWTTPCRYCPKDDKEHIMLLVEINHSTSKLNERESPIVRTQILILVHVYIVYKSTVFHGRCFTGSFFLPGVLKIKSCINFINFPIRNCPYK